MLVHILAAVLQILLVLGQFLILVMIQLPQLVLLGHLHHYILRVAHIRPRQILVAALVLLLLELHFMLVMDILSDLMKFLFFGCELLVIAVVI